MRKAPLILMIVLLISAIIWGGLWLGGKTATEKLLAHWLQEREDEGWTVSVDDVTTRGFPNRLDTTISGLSLFDPDTGLSFSAETLQNLSLIYKPTHVIAVIPGPQTFGSHGHSTKMEAEVFRGSLQFGAALDLPIERAVFEIAQADMVSSEGWTAHVGAGQLSMRQTPGVLGNVYDIDVTGQNIAPSSSFMDRIARSGAFSEVIQSVNADLTVRFDEPWDRYAIERARPQPREVEVTRITATWGALALDMTGILVVDAAGIPAGEVDVTATNWREMITVAEASGALNPALANVVTRVLSGISRRSGDPTTLNAVLTFTEGKAYLGRFPIGPAPEIKLP
ncbi:MAG: DUF2125 domain-containing protein [Maritimibacter sp.]